MPRRQAAELQHVRTAIKLQPEEARAEAAEGNPAAQHPSEQLDGEAAATASTAADDTAKAAEREHAASDDVQEPAAAGGVPGTADTSDEFECKRMLWMAGLQVGGWAGRRSSTAAVPCAHSCIHAVACDAHCPCHNRADAALPCNCTPVCRPRPPTAAKRTTSPAAPATCATMPLRCGQRGRTPPPCCLSWWC